MNKVLELNIKAKPELINEFPMQWYWDFGITRYQVGSRAICVPPPLDTDDDWCIAVTDLEEASKALKAYGWEEGGQDYPDKDFISFRQKGNEINLIITDKQEIFKKFVIATRVCRKMNVMDKPTRIYIHNQIFSL